MTTKFFRKTINGERRLVETLRAASLLMILCFPVMLPAQNGVTVSGLVVDAGTVTFNVSWDKNDPTMPAVWSDTVWVWVDYNTAGTMTRLPLAPGATLTNTSEPGVAKVIPVDGNNKGVWVVGNARDAGSFSATVRLLTATATATAACAYASNYPPVGEYTSVTNISFRGTPPYDIILKEIDGSGTIIDKSSSTFSVPAGYTLSFTDKTGAPGIINCIMPPTYNLTASALSFCTGNAGVQFYLSGTQSGADYQLYRNDLPISGATFTGTGSPATFSGSFNVAGTYTAQSLFGTYCPVTMNGAPVVTENPRPVVPTNPSSNSRCGSGTVTFSATAPSGCTIDWYTTSTGTTLVSGGGSVTSFSPSISTSTTYYAQARNSTTGCVSATRLAVTGTVNAVPTVPTGASSNARCGSGTVTFSATAPSGCTIDWYTTSTGTTLVSGGGTVTSFSPSISTSTTYYAQARNSTTGCVSTTRLAVTGTVNAVPTVPTGASSNARCGSGTVTFSATVPSGCTIDWYTTSTGTTLMSGGGSVTSFSLSISTSTTYYAQARNSTTGCVSATRLAVTGTMNALPANPTGTNGSRCGSGTVTISATSSGAVIDWYNAASGGTLLLSGNNSYTPSISTSTTYYAQAHNNTTGCLSAARTAVGATINAIPVNPTGVNSSRIDAGTVTISATTTSSGAVIEWYSASSGGASLYTGNSYTPSITGSTTYYAQAKVTATGCISAGRTAVVATMLTRPANPTGVGSTRCGSGTVTISATTTSPDAVIDWYSTATDESAFYTGNTYTILSISTSTTYYAEARSTSTGLVSASRTSVVVTVNSVAAPSVTHNGFCGASGRATLLASRDGATINWYNVATDGTALLSGSNTYTTPVLYSSATYYAEAYDPVTTCKSTRATVYAYANETPGTPTVTAGSRCGPGTVTLSTNYIINATFDWYTALSGGTLLQSGTATGYGYFTTPSLNSSTTYYVQARNIYSGCMSARVPVPVTVTNPAVTVAAPTASVNGSRCGSGTVTVSATPPSGAVIDWYSYATGGSVLSGGSATNTYTTSTIYSSTTYYAQARIGGCVSATRRPVAATMYSTSAPSVTHGGLNNCGAAGTVTLLASRSESRIDWYNAATGGTVLRSNSNTYTTPTISTSSTYYAEAYPTAYTSCKSTRAAVYAYINTTSSATPTVPEGVRCSPGTLTLTANAISNATFDWYTALSGGSLLQSGTSTANRSFTTPSLNSSTTYYVRSRDIYTGCVSARVPVAASVVSTNSSATPTVPAVLRCGPGTVTLTANAITSTTFDWYDALSGGNLLQGGTTTANRSFTTPSLNSSTTYYVRSRNLQTDCVSARVPASASVTPSSMVPAAPTASNVSRCGSGTVTLTAVPPSGAVVEWYSAATGGTTLTTGNSYTVSVSSSRNYYAGARVGGCVSTIRTPVAVTVNPNAAPVVTHGGVQNCAYPSAVTLVASPTSGAVVNWYNTATGGSVLLSGSNTYTTPVLYSNAAYYVDSYDPATGCRSTTRAPINAYVGQFSPATPTIYQMGVRCGPGTVPFTANAITNTTFDWYSAASGGTLLQRGTSASDRSFTPYISTSTTYYVQSRDLYTGCVSARVPALTYFSSSTMTVANPTASTIAARCGSSTVTFSARPPSGAVIDWYSSTSSSAASLTTGNSYTVSLSSSRTYYAQARNGGCVSARTPVSATINSIPSTPYPSDVSRCTAGTVTMYYYPSSGEVIEWYNAATGGTKLYTGNSYTVSISSNSTYYAQASNTTTGCISSSRRSVTASIRTASGPSVTHGGARATGQVTLYAWQSGAVIDWYNAATGGTRLLANSNTSPPTISTSTTYYAEAYNSTTGCRARTAVYACMNNTDTPATTTARGSRCLSGPVTLSASTTTSSVAFDWYSVATGGTPLKMSTWYIDSTFTTPSIDRSTTYYVQTRNTGTGCVSARTPALARVGSTFTVNLQPTNIITCPGGTVTLKATVTGPASTYDYMWHMGGSGTMTMGRGSSSLTTYPAYYNTTYTVNGIDACAITSNQALITVVTAGCPTAPPCASASTTNFTAFSPSASAAVGTSWCLTDTRESNNHQTYQVRKMPDGRIWMVQDMKFGDKCAKENYSCQSCSYTNMFLLLSLHIMATAHIPIYTVQTYQVPRLAIITMRLPL